MAKFHSSEEIIKKKLKKFKDGNCANSLYQEVVCVGAETESLDRVVDVSKNLLLHENVDCKLEEFDNIYHPPVADSSNRKIDGRGKTRETDIVIDNIYSLVAREESMVKVPGIDSDDESEGSFELDNDDPAVVRGNDHSI